MSDSIVTVENVGKRYLLRHERLGKGYGTLRDELASALAAPMRRLRRNGRRQPDQIQEFWALRDVSFEVREGEVLGIIGRNGAGKSTLLKILSRITEPTTGRVTLRRSVASLLEVGTGFHPELTGRENIFLNGAILGMPRAEIARRFDEIVAFADVEQFLDTPIKRYSSGMYVRLAFAVAAHLEPEILIVDEVLAVGDVEFQQKCLRAMGTFARAGRTVLLVSHNMAAVRGLCTRALLMQSGALEDEGDPAHMVMKYMAGAVTKATVDLREWRDREGSGRGKIVSFAILGDSGAVSDVVPTSGSVTFQMQIDLNESIAQPSFGVLVHTDAGEPLLDLRSQHNGLFVGRTKGSLQVEVRLDNLGLYPGEYLLSPWFMDGADKHVSVDWVRSCARLYVVPAISDIAISRLDPTWGKYWIPSKWRVSQCSNEGSLENRETPVATGPQQALVR